MGSDLLAKLAVLGTTVIAVRSLPPLRFGQFIGLSATAYLAAWFWDAGVASVITREIAAGRVAARGGLTQAIRLRLKVVPLWLLTLLVGSMFIDRDRGLSLAVLLTFGVASAVFSFHTILLAILRAHLRFAAAGIATALGRTFTAFASLAALPLLGLGHPLATLALALLGGEILILVAGAAAVLRVDSFWASGNGAERLLITLRAGLPFNANNLLLTTYNRFDVVILSALSSVAQLGLYAPASRIQDALFLVPSSLGLIAFPLVSAASAQGRAQDVRKLVRFLIAIGLALAIPIAIAMTAMTPAIIRIVLGSSYVGASTATRILAWSLPFAVVEAPLLAALMGAGHAGKTTQVYAGAFLAAITMHLSLDWWLGATGGAIASLSREPVAVLILIVIVKRVGILGGLPVFGRRHLRPPSQHEHESRVSVAEPP